MGSSCRAARKSVTICGRAAPEGPVRRAVRPRATRAPFDVRFAMSSVSWATTAAAAAATAMSSAIIRRTGPS